MKDFKSVIFFKITPSKLWNYEMFFLSFFITANKSLFEIVYSL